MSKKIYACFIDFRKAFDTINRDALFYKLSYYNIDGPFFSIMKDMYKEVLYSVKISEGITDFFNSSVGVKQGCILSPTLFSLYINDLPSIFDSTCEPPKLNDNDISYLLYADDLVLINKFSRPYFSFGFTFFYFILIYDFKN